MIDTAADIRALIIDSPFQVLVYLGGGSSVYAIKSHTPELALEYHGRRSVLRCVAADVADVTVGQNVTVTEAGADTVYRVAELIPHNQTTQIVLEQT